MNYLQLKTIIADDIMRNDMSAASTVVAKATTSAILHYQKERWWFSETASDTSTATIPNQAYYNPPSDALEIDNIKIMLSGQWYSLGEPVSYTEIDEEDTGLFTGPPTKWAFYKNMVRMYPVPDKTYTVAMSYSTLLGEPATATASNAWTTTASDLIRYRAEADLFGKARNMEMKQNAIMEEQRCYSQLNKENISKVTVGKIKRRSYP